MATASPPQDAASGASTPVRSGWLGFAGMLAIMLGIFNAIEGVIALVREDYFVTAAGDLLVFDYNTWGWIWLVVGIVQVLVGAGIMSGAAWARWTGVLLVALAMIGQFAFLAAYPIWAVINITLCVLVMYGLIAAPKGSTA